MAPFDLKEAMEGINEMYTGNVQHDAHEFLTHFIEGLNLGLNRIETEKESNKRENFRA